MVGFSSALPESVERARLFDLQVQALRASGELQPFWISTACWTGSKISCRKIKELMINLLILTLLVD